jgi:predicted O-methyltransferase YrrM
MKFEIIHQKIKHLFGVSHEQGRKLYDFILENSPKNILELGFAHGKSTSYMAAALDELGDGRIITIDNQSAKQLNPEINTLLKEFGLDVFVKPIFAERSYTWELMKLIASQTDKGICKPCFDFCFMDGGHTWDATGYAFFLVEKILNSKGWILFDDLNWTLLDDHPEPESNWIKKMPQEFKTTAQVGKIFELLVQQHESFENFRVEDAWGWAQKK